MNFLISFFSLAQKNYLRLFITLAALALFLTAGWACNSASTENVVQAEVTATPEAQANPKDAAPAEASSAETAKTAGSASEAKDKSATVAETLLPDSRHIEGAPDAPVTIVVFSDFKCPYCAGFATDSFRWIREYYIKTGRVRFAFSHVATLGPESSRAAEASECAAEQDQFWAYHDQIFADQASKGSQLDDQRLAQFAAEVGLDATAFKECLVSGRYTDEIKLQTQAANTLGIQATPGFIINNTMMVGAQPYGTFAKIINQELEKVGWEPPPGQENVGVIDEIQGLIVYPPNPPTDDILNGVLQNCGIYDEEVSIDNILASLAHGAVWIAYNPNLPAEQVDYLRELVDHAQQDEPMIILSPGPYTDKQIVATAWQVQLILEDAKDPRLAQFIETFQVGPFTPQQGELCSGGVGEPLNLN
jgi:protein-disulfide isomerase